ncbi:GIY-YIG nuclease family protein [Diaminobutyricimonas sp. LJ205]|uniref:GIY-YIG nuclease family protein n=1 Tax=Diaminobutyricimonas sp. LJ205 TaxID=2683590 RepID=UPI0012F5133F|nr:GIY-YIG nuclease family protein [Diaminobutyricimonas sp. LJ205]
MPFMYILECSDGSYYVGSTWDLSVRFEQHQAGSVPGYTARRLPVKLAYAEEFNRIDDAYAREKQVQNWSRAKRRALIDGRIDDLRRLSRGGGSA